jgi:sec-independent protein translocase protein TatA
MQAGTLQERTNSMPFHGPELIIVLVIALLIFGPKKLPEMGSAIGKSIKEFKRGVSELTSGKDKEDEKEPSAASIEAIERELASKKAAASAREAKQPEVEVEQKENPVAEKTV